MAKEQRPSRLSPPAGPTDLEVVAVRSHLDERGRRAITLTFREAHVPDAVSLVRTYVIGSAYDPAATLVDTWLDADGWQLVRLVGSTIPYGDLLDALREPYTHERHWTHLLVGCVARFDVSNGGVGALVPR